ncbi:uncharacterized protein LOC134258595 isoform X1 [Saccostrea cucullata]|uniref:uncharacterized protein LOC134258595 isoform X1 n=1 Tax=Saccostrea cuccullata TaxID=36930 RepID=UPI002ED4A171
MQTFSIAKMCICVRYFPIIIHFTLSHVTAENNGACLASIPTISHVSHCPLTIEKWNERASKKRCQDIPQHCSEDFSYHCVINSFRNATIEVCAKPRQIAGGCAEFNYGRGSIQIHQAYQCKTCLGKVYNSTNAYKYKECYEFQTQEVNIITENSQQGIRPYLVKVDNLANSDDRSAHSDHKMQTILLTVMCVVIS